MNSRVRTFGLRVTSFTLLAVLLGAPLACGDRNGTPTTPGSNSCQSIAWGGWNGTPACGGIAAIVVSPEQRVCVNHSDCVIVGNNRCAAHAVNQEAAPRASQNPPPCGHPLAAICTGVRWSAACQQGCCVPVSSR